MSKYVLEEELRFEASALADAFRLGRIEVRRQLRSILREGHFGSFVSLAKIDDGGEIQLWLDRASGHDHPLFWCGLRYGTKKELDSAILRANVEAQPKHTLTASDMRKVAEGGLTPKEPLPLEIMNGTIAERLDPDGYTPEFYLGRYFFDYSIDAALTYLRSLLGQHVDDEGFWEGEVLQRMASFYERNTEARRGCLTKYGCVCVVCKINFLDTYGDIGRNFIHVHHTNPLAKREGRSLTKLNELVPVCPNCHAMLHRGSLKTPEELRAIMAKAKK